MDQLWLEGQKWLMVATGMDGDIANAFIGLSSNAWSHVCGDGFMEAGRLCMIFQFVARDITTENNN